MCFDRELSLVDLRVKNWIAITMGWGGVSEGILRSVVVVVVVAS